MSQKGAIVCYCICGIMIKIGVDVNQEISPDDDAESAGDEDESAVKHTVLHVAAECTSEDVAKYLVKHGADVNKKDGDENTAYDIAKGNQFFRMLIFEVGCLG